MSTVIRPEPSLKSKYWLPKERYYELKHFCLQYPEWKKRYLELDGSASHSPSLDTKVDGGYISDPTASYVEERLYYRDRMTMVEVAAKDAFDDLGIFLLKSVTQGISYECLRAQENVPCCKEVWYAAYRRFFWLLDKARK